MAAVVSLPPYKEGDDIRQSPCWVCNKPATSWSALYQHARKAHLPPEQLRDTWLHTQARAEEKITEKKRRERVAGKAPAAKAKGGGAPLRVSGPGAGGAPAVKAEEPNDSGPGAGGAPAVKAEEPSEAAPAGQWRKMRVWVWCDPAGKPYQPLEAHLRKPQVQETGEGESTKR